MDEYHRFVLILQIIGIVSFTITILALLNSLYLYVFQYKHDQANTSFSISIAVIFIFIGDSLANGTYLSSYRPPTGSLDCFMTGFIHVFGYMITWMFTFYLAYIMYSATVWETMPIHVRRDLTLCIGIPLVLVIIQALFFGFAVFTSAPYDVCFTALHNTTQEIYHWISFWCLLFLVCVSMLTMRFHQFLLEVKQDQRTQTHLFTASKVMLQTYPFILILCWIPTIIETNTTSSQTSQSFRLYATIMKISHGLLVGSIYFLFGELARKHFWQSLNPFLWIKLLKVSDNNDDNDMMMLRISHLVGGTIEEGRESNLEMSSSKEML